MAIIVIKRDIVGLGFPPRVRAGQEGNYHFSVNEYNNYEYETTEGIKRYWDSLRESEQRHFIEILVQGTNGDLENILRNAMRNNE